MALRRHEITNILSTYFAHTWSRWLLAFGL